MRGGHVPYVVGHIGLVADSDDPVQIAETEAPNGRPGRIIHRRWGREATAITWR
jgi:hypothetical protein